MKDYKSCTVDLGRIQRKVMFDAIIGGISVILIIGLIGFIAVLLD